RVGSGTPLAVDQDDGTDGNVLDSAGGDELPFESPSRALGLIDRGDHLRPGLEARVTDLRNVDGHSDRRAHLRIEHDGIRLITSPAYEETMVLPTGSRSLAAIPSVKPGTL